METFNTGFVLLIAGGIEIAGIQIAVISVIVDLFEVGINKNSFNI